MPAWGTVRAAPERAAGTLQPELSAAAHPPPAQLKEAGALVPPNPGRAEGLDLGQALALSPRLMSGSRDRGDGCL